MRVVYALCCFIGTIIGLIATTLGLDPNDPDVFGKIYGCLLGLGVICAYAYNYVEGRREKAWIVEQSSRSKDLTAPAKLDR